MAEHTSEHHIVPLKYYFGVFALLMVFTALTVWVAKFDLPGLWNIIVAMTVACIKATAVILIFMHVRWSSKLTQVIIIAGLFWLAILLIMTMGDYLVRGGWGVLGVQPN
jgi:cytochrome c oxidase subunit 4